MTDSFKEVIINKAQGLSLSKFQEMDYFAVEQYNLPIELMMENAGLQLATLVARNSDSNSKILIGVGNGNNGGGGLVAARRLAAWGYEVHLDLFTELTRDLPARQLERALKFGVSDKPIANPDVWIDAYLGFSQVLPLRPNLLERISNANALENCLRVSLDIPTGFLGDPSSPHFNASKVLSLAAAKEILFNLNPNSEVYIADLGIPKEVYQKFNIDPPPFKESSVLKITVNDKPRI